MLASLFWCLGAFFSGIILGGFLPNLHSRIWMVGGVLFAILLRHYPKWRKAFILIACLMIGIGRIQRLESPDKYIAEYFGQNQIWDFWVCADPEPDWDGQSVVLCPQPPLFSEKAYDAKVAVKLSLYPRVHYGDALRLQCRLEKPAVFADFDYAAYLAVRGIGATCSWPKVVDIQEDGAGSAVMRKLYRYKREGLQLLNRALPEPAAGLASALLLGYKHTLAENEETNFSKAGLSHIVAISGGHISLFLELIISLAVYLGMNKRRAIWPALLLAGLYVLLTGMQSSALRSLIMGGIMLYAWRRGRLQTAWLPLALAAAFMLYHNPLLWRYDLGFQLSFLAIAGMIAFNPIMATRINPYESSLIRFGQTLGSAFKLSFSAQIAVWPLLALTSGGVSLISPFTNVLAFWVFGPLVVSLLAGMGLCLIVGVSPHVFTPAYVLLEYLLRVGRIGAHFPMGYIEVTWFSYWHAVVYYCGLIFFLLLRQKRKGRIDK